MKFILSAALVLLAVSVSAATTYDHNLIKTTNKNVFLSTKIDDSDKDNIKFKFAVDIAKNSAEINWVCFGVTTQAASMPGADIGCLNTADPRNMSDWFARGYAAPTADNCGDSQWKDGQFRSNSTHVRIEGWRLVKSTDTYHDRDIVVAKSSAARHSNQLQKFIFAFGPHEKVSFAFHGPQNVATCNVNLNTGETGAPASMKAGKLSFFAGNSGLGYNLTEGGTKYQNSPCQVIPTNLRNGFVTGFEAAFDSKTSSTYNYVHHIIVRAFRDSSCAGFSTAVQIFATGSDPATFLNMPYDEVSGQQIAIDMSNFLSLEVEVHYEANNFLAFAAGTTSIVDHTGVNMYFTTTAPPEGKKYLASFLQVGDPTVNARFTTKKTLYKPASNNSIYRFECPANCTEKFGSSIFVHAMFQHTHTDGVFISDVFLRNGVVQASKVTDFYDFHRQRVEVLETAVEVKPGDVIQSTYGYSLTKPREFGLGTDQEMAITFMLVTPSLERSDGQTIPYLYCGYGMCGSMIRDEGIDSTDLMVLGSEKNYNRSWGFDGGYCAAPSRSDAQDLSDGEIAGIAVGAAVGFCLIVGIVFLVASGSGSAAAPAAKTLDA